MQKQNLQTLKGFRDFLPSEKRARDFVAGKIKATFERFGFEPLETPTLEYAELLLGKYGAEADKLVYSFTDRGGREVALRYDQTVPTARVLTQYQNQLGKGFRRYQIQPVFRADKPQKGRYREFTQCDIDIFGVTSPLADAEIIACTYAAFTSIGFAPKLVINDRQVLFDALAKRAANKVSVLSIIQSIDKLDKLKDQEVIDELQEKGLSEFNAFSCLSDIRAAKPTAKLTSILKILPQLGVPESGFVFNPFIARGLDYYTGMIFEVQLADTDLGSFGGGGRYDNLIKQLGGPDIPAVGIAFGFDRMVEAAIQFGLIPPGKTNTQVLVTIFSSTLQGPTLQAAQSLREAGINTELYPDPSDKLDKQFKYADKKGIPYALVIGEDEVAKQVVTLKNLATREQATLTLDEAIGKLR